MEVLARFFTENVNLLNLLVSTALNTFFVWVIVHYFYYPKGRRRDITGFPLSSNTGRKALY